MILMIDISNLLDRTCWNVEFGKKRSPEGLLKRIQNTNVGEDTIYQMLQLHQQHLYHSQPHHQQKQHHQDQT